MRLFIKSLISIPLFAVCLHAQDAKLIKEAKQNLDSALSEYNQRSGEISKVEAQAIERVERLDNKALDMSRELRKLERDVALASTEKENLKTLLEARNSEFEFLNGTLKTYSRGLTSRMQASEVQVYRDQLNDLETQADAKKVLSDQLSERLKVISLGIERINKVAGGQIFEGRADDGTDNLMKGKFALVGPAAFFADNSSKKAGIVRFVEGDTGIPGIAALAPERASLISETIQSGTGNLLFDPTLGKALKMEQTKETFSEHIAKGGYVGYCILGLGVISVLIAIFKVIEIKAFTLPRLRQINAVLDDLIEGRKDEAATKAEKLNGKAGEMVQVGVRHFYSKRRVLEELLFEKIVSMRPKLERFLPFVAVTAAAAPLMGLLGTVMGMIKTFKLITVFGTGDAKNLASGISEALVTTELGLVVAIPTLILHGFLKRMAKGKISDVESIALMMLNGTAEIDDDAISTEVAKKKTDGDIPSGSLQPA